MVPPALLRDELEQPFGVPPKPLGSIVVAHVRLLSVVRPRTAPNHALAASTTEKAGEGQRKTLHTGRVCDPVFPIPGAYLLG